MPKLLPHRVAVETDRPKFPNVCCCSCRAVSVMYRPTPPPRAQGLPVAEPLELPYSEECYEQMRLGHRIATWKLGLLNAAIWGFGIPFIAGFGVLGYVPGAILTGLIGLRVVAMIRSNPCSVCGRAKRGDAMRVVWWRGPVYLFTFASSRYAEMFREANENSLADGGTERGGPVGKSGPEGWQGTHH